MGLDHHHHHHHTTGPRDRPWLHRTIQPQSELQLPLTVAEFSQYLEDPCPPDSGSQREALFEQMLLAATDAVVEWTDRELLERTVVTRFDAYARGRLPQGGLLPLALPEPAWLYLPRVAADPDTVVVELVDPDGNAEALAQDAYAFDDVAVPHRLHLDTYAASGNLAPFGALRVTYNAGYASNEDVPQTLKLGVMMYAAWLYERRGADASSPLQTSGAAAVLRRWRVLTGL